MAAPQTIGVQLLIFDGLYEMTALNKENKESLQTQLAVEAFKKADYLTALEIYQKLAQKFDKDIFYVNILICEKKIADQSNKSNPCSGNLTIFVSQQNDIQEAFMSLVTLPSAWLGEQIQHARDKVEEVVVWSSIQEKDIEKFTKIINDSCRNKCFQRNIEIQLLLAADFFKNKRFDLNSLNIYNLIAKTNPIENNFKLVYWAAFKSGKYSIAKKVIEDIKKISGKKKINEVWLAKAEKRLTDTFCGFSEIIKALQPQRNDKYFAGNARKIAYFLHNSLPYSSGGYATRAHGMANGLKNNGYEVICVSRPGFPLDVDGDHQGKDISSCDTVDGIPYYRILNPQRKNIAGNAYMLEAAKAIQQFLRQQQVDIVVAASNHLTAIPAGIAARALGLPYFYEVRGFWEVTRISREPEYEKTPQYAGQIRNETEAAIHADAVFTLTTPMKEELMRRGVSAEKITLLPNSCDPERFNPRSRDQVLAAKLDIPAHVPVIGYIGSFVQYEGLENLAQAAALLLKKNIDFRLLLVGNENASSTERGPITEEILRVAREEGLAEKLIMPGRIPHEEVESYYSLIDIAPFPRKPQPVTEMVSPMKPLEALAMEKAIIVSSVRALTEMVTDQQTGLIFEKGNIQDLADKLEMLIQDATLRTKLGKAGRIWVENERTWKKTAHTACGVVKNYIY